MSSRRACASKAVSLGGFVEEEDAAAAASESILVLSVRTVRVLFHSQAFL